MTKSSTSKSSTIKSDYKTLAALLYPVQTGELDLPPNAEILFLNAKLGPEIVPLKARMTCVQGFRPDYDALKAAGLRVSEVVPDTLFDVVLCCLSKHKTKALADIALGLTVLKPGGVLICCGRNDTGAATVAKSAQKLGPVMQMSKYHHRVFWLHRTSENLPEICTDWLDAIKPQFVKAINGLSVPGIFGWNKVDRGSRLLAEAIDSRITGAVADFGAGWGYLSQNILSNCPDITSLAVLEAEYLALCAAQENVESASCPVTFDWIDVGKLDFGRCYDWIVSNPPFHSGKSADVDMGLTFIRMAQKSLKLGGRLLLVANRHLPYESTLDQLFGSWEIIAEDPAFKVMEARLRG